MFPKIAESCMNCAEDAGNLTWKEGLLLSGNGLNNGITGNSYLLFSLSRGY